MNITEIESLNPDTGTILDSVIYDGRCYHVKGRRGELVPMPEAALKRWLRSNGIEDTKKDDLLTRTLIDIQLSQYALRVGPLAGHREGWHEVAEGRVYISRSPYPVAPVAGDAGLLRRLLVEMLGDEQFQWFMRWLGIGYRSLVSGSYRPGQAVAFVGAVACGKSLIAGIVAEAFGGRTAHPFKSWSEGNGFNGHLLGAETLLIDDETPSRDGRLRRNMASAIRSQLFSDTVNIEAKYATPFTARPWWRLIITCNNEPDAVAVLPPLDSTVHDKIAFLAVTKPDFPDLSTDAGRTAFRRRLSAELPALLAEAVAMPIAPFATDDRTGIETHHNSDVLELLRELTKEHHFELLLADAERDRVFTTPWQGTASELQSILTAFESTVAARAKSLFGDWPSAVGVLLGELSRSKPDRVSQGERSATERQWIIHPMTG